MNQKPLIDSGPSLRFRAETSLGGVYAFIVTDRKARPLPRVALTL